MKADSSLLGTAPTLVSTTLPSLNISMAGMPRMANCGGVCGFSSTFIFANVNLPAYSPASSSSTGATILHGPHHSAQKSTNTGPEADNTSCWKLSSLTFTIFSLMDVLSQVNAKIKWNTPGMQCNRAYTVEIWAQAGKYNLCISTQTSTCSRQTVIVRAC